MEDKIQKILFYYSANKKSVALESQMIIFKDFGFEVSILTSCDKGVLHENLELKGIKTYHIPRNYLLKITIFNYIINFIYILWFTKKHKINFIFAHLHLPCFVSSYAQFFTKSKFLFFRHNCSWFNNEDILLEDQNKNERKIDAVINKRANKIIVPSKGVKDYMVEYENVNSEKIDILHYVYDFNLYKLGNKNKLDELNKKYENKFMLLMASRMVKHKRHFIVLEVLKELVKEINNLHLILLDEGPEIGVLKEYVKNNNLSEYVDFIGFTSDFLEYMTVADVLIQPSMTDASNSVAKEMGMLSKVIMVSENVGDYSEYIKNEENGFLLPIHNTKYFLRKYILDLFYNRYDKNNLGINLRKTIINNFTFGENQKKEYQDFIRKHLQS